jgi:hypothetical protein
MAKITINGCSFDIQGDSNINVGGMSITSKGGSIIVNGKTIKDGLSGAVTLHVEGAVANIEADGDVSCGDVTGSITAGGSIKCGAIGGNLSAGGSVTGGAVGGSVQAGGSVKIYNGKQD